MVAANTLRPLPGQILRLGTHGTHLTSFAGARSGAAPFSTTARQCKRKTKDSNKARGVSSLYGSGPREHLSMSDIPLPKPREFKPKVEMDENHGLWGFFPSPGKCLWTPQETEKHGRAWTVEELRKKSWEDLHALWWTCCKERNLLSTSRAELARSQLGFGDRELEMRDDEVRKTMRSIKHALTERFYTWEDAVDVAASDPEINMMAEEGEPVYSPSAYEDEPETDPGLAEAPRETKDARTEPSIDEKTVPR